MESKTLEALAAACPWMTFAIGICCVFGFAVHTCSAVEVAKEPRRQLEAQHTEARALRAHERFSACREHCNGESFCSGATNSTLSCGCGYACEPRKNP